MSSTLQELRRTRRARRLGELEWFEIAYRVYLVALVGGGAVLWASDLVTDVAATAEQVADVRQHGPAVLGMFLVVAIALGLRSGSDGGPVALEAADVRHLLLAPIARRAVLTRPIVQRLRAMAFGGAVVGGIAGELAAIRLPGSPAAWTASGALAGAIVGVAFVVVAVLAHVWRFPRPAATAIAVALVAAQVGTIVGWSPVGPGDSIGSLALWAMRQHPVDLVGVAIAAAAGATATALAGQLRTEPLVRRADLVSQLRFAVTMQDLRTVVLLRRQLRGEHPRRRPWITMAPSRGSGATRSVWRRGWRGLLRYPSSRLVRMSGLAVAAGAVAVVTVNGTTPAIVGVGLGLHLLGLDAVEPLSQEIDHPDHTDATPRPRGWLLARHLSAPAVAIVPFALLAAVVVGVADPDRAVAAAALAVPITWAAAAGAVVSIVRDAPDPLRVPASNAMPPEFAGFASTIRLLWPLALSTLACAPVLAMRELPTAGTALRSAAALALFCAAVGWWVRRRDEWRRRMRNFLDAGRNARISDGASK